MGHKKIIALWVIMLFVAQVDSQTLIFNDHKVEENILVNDVPSEGALLVFITDMGLEYESSMENLSNPFKRGKDYLLPINQRTCIINIRDPKTGATGNLSFGQLSEGSFKTLNKGEIKCFEISVQNKLICFDNTEKQKAEGANNNQMLYEKEALLIINVDPPTLNLELLSSRKITNIKKGKDNYLVYITPEDQYITISDLESNATETFRTGELNVKDVRYYFVFLPSYLRKSEKNSDIGKIDSGILVPDLIDAEALYETAFVRGGNFQMGSNGTRYEDETPEHRVTVSDFFIGKFEVTVTQFEQFIKSTSYQTDADLNGGSEIETALRLEKKEGINWRYDQSGAILPTSEYSRPVVHVSWNDANAYVTWLSRQTGKPYRLPTEAEWEYAAGGGALKSPGKATVYSGSKYIDSVAWYQNNSGGKIHSVGKKQANQLGLHDMSGNVFEWCADNYVKDYYRYGPSTNPQATSRWSARVIRGGSYELIGEPITRRRYFEQNRSAYCVGLRLVISSD